jgi:tetratricopeptide (TPR) repeat protein
MSRLATTVSIPVVVAALAAGAGVLASGGTASRTGSEDALALWDDPTFQKQFLGSFGVESGIEPEMDEVDRETMREVLPLLQSEDFAAAADALERALAAPDTFVEEDERKSRKRRKREEEQPVQEPGAVIDFTLANIYFQLDRLDDAVRYYKSAIGKFPSFRRAHRNLGLIEVRQGRFADAVAPLSRVIQLGGADGLTYGLLGFAYVQTGNWVSAESAYRAAILLQPDVADWRIGLAQSLLKQGKSAEAASIADELIAEDPDRSEYWKLQGNAYVQMGKPLAAAQNFEILRRMGRADADTLHLLGDVYVNESLWDLAAGAYAEALRADPGQPPQRPLRNVETLSKRGALGEAKRLLRQTHELMGGRLEPADRKKLLKLEARIAVSEGEGGDAVPILEQIVKMDPLDGDALILLGNHHASEGETDRAIFYFERAEALPQFEADARVRHAQLLVSEGRYEDAIPLLKRALDLRPRDDVQRYLEQIQRVARIQR